MDQLPLFEIDKLRGKDGRPVRNGGRVSPYIPSEIIVAAVELMGAIDLDPYCVDEESTMIPAKVHLKADKKSLKEPWGPKRRRVFLMPPAGRSTAKWINKLCDEYEEGSVGQGVAYLRAALDNDWWTRLTAYPICIVHRQLHMIAGKRSTSPSIWAVVYLGPNLKGFAEAFGQIGTLYVPYQRQVATVSHEPPVKKKAYAQPTDPANASGSVRTVRKGNFTLTMNPHACYITVANPVWDSDEQAAIRAAILDIPGMLPRQYSSVSKSKEGLIKLVFSFKKGQADAILGRIKKLVARSARQPAPDEAPPEEAAAEPPPKRRKARRA